jgi:hypothetical protein
MNVIWLGGAVAAVALALFVLSFFRRGRNDRDMGVLSDQWMAEQRLRREGDNNR